MSSTNKKDQQKRTEMYYAEPVYRPPSEAYSLLIQATVGCSSAASGHCYFCGSSVFHRTIPEKRFRIRPIDEIILDIDIARKKHGTWVEKVFLLDSNAMIIKTADLLKILNKCHESFPNLRQVSCYACSGDILRKNDNELTELRNAGLKLVFVGLESGDQETLDLMHKGCDVQDQIAAVKKAENAGIKTSVTAIIGLGGKKLSRQHAINTGKAVGEMNPAFFATLTLMIFPDTPLDGMVKRREFEMVTDPMDILSELELMIENINAMGPISFRTNHASNYLPLYGTIPDDKNRLLDTIRKGINNPDLLRPESARGL